MRRRLLVLITTLVAAWLLLAAPASAVCEGTAPTPTHPYGILGDGMLTEPTWAEVPAVTPDPWGTPKASLVDTYGYGYQWGTYDLGCGVDVARDPLAVLTTMIANLGWIIPSGAAALVSALQDVATMGPFDFLDPLVASIATSVRDKLWTTWFPIAVLCAGFFVLLSARKASYSVTAQTVGWVALVLSVSALFLSAPAKVDRVMSDGMTKVVTTASSPFGHDSVDEQLSREVLYPQWLQGELGTASGKTAVEYGPRLFAATHYSWSEEKLMRADPTWKAREEITKAKGKDFKAVAAELEKQDPAAYSHLTGKQGESRLTAVLFAGITTFGLALFVCLGFLILALAQLMVRVFVLAFPIAGILAVAHPRGRFAVEKLWGFLTAAILAAIKFAILTTIYTVVAGGIMQAPIGGIARIAALLLLAILALMFAKPFRSFKTMVPGLDANKSYMATAAKVFVAAKVGQHVVTEGVEDGIEHERAATPTPRPRPAEATSASTIPPPPPPVTVVPTVVDAPAALPPAPEHSTEPIYQPTGHRNEVDVSMPSSFAEKQVDESGREVFVIYQRPAATG
jgi:hypothetical protein